MYCTRIPEIEIRAEDGEEGSRLSSGEVQHTGQRRGGPEHPSTFRGRQESPAPGSTRSGATSTRLDHQVWVTLGSILIHKNLRQFMTYAVSAFKTKAGTWCVPENRTIRDPAAPRSDQREPENISS